MTISTISSTFTPTPSLTTTVFTTCASIPTPTINIATTTPFTTSTTLPCPTTIASSAILTTSTTVTSGIHSPTPTTISATSPTPTPTAMPSTPMATPMPSTLVITSLALVVVLAAALFIVTVVLGYCVYRARRDVKILSRLYNRVSMSQLEKGQKEQILHEYVKEPPGGGRFSTPPPEPLPITTTSTTSSSNPPPPQMKPQPTSYSAVNVLGLIPEELRTRENLEGRELPEDQQEEFMKQCLKEQQQYEEQELKHHDNQPSQQDTPKPATTGINMKVRSISPPGYEDVPDPHYADDDYKNPADTLPGHFMSSSPVKVSPPGGGRKFQIEQRKDAGQEEYTPVFDSLGPGKAERIGEPVIRPRGHSDSSPLVKQFSGDNHSDPTEFNFNTAVLPIVAEGKSSSLPPNSLEDLVGAYSESKRPSSKRNSAKEFVEFDPTTRKGRMESQRKKKPKLNGTVSKNDDNERDSPDGDAKGAESAGSASPVKSKEFEVSGGNMSDSYAVVALVDKKQYRTEADMMKKEGSGKPEHYSASLKRSIKSSAENTSV